MIFKHYGHGQVCLIFTTVTYLRKILGYSTIRIFLQMNVTSSLQVLHMSYSSGCGFKNSNKGKGESAAAVYCLLYNLLKRMARHPALSLCLSSFSCLTTQCLAAVLD